MKSELVKILRDAFTYEEGYDFSLECAIYWFAANWYDGQDDPLYRVLCNSPYHPGCMESGPDSNDDYLAKDMYDYLVEHFSA